MGVTAAGITGGEPREMTITARVTPVTDRIYGIAPTDEDVKGGPATDTWSSYIAFDAPSLYILLECFNNSLDIELSVNGGTSYKDTKEVTVGIPLLIPFTATGFRVKNTTPGSNSRYEITAFGTGF